MVNPRALTARGSGRSPERVVAERDALGRSAGDELEQSCFRGVSVRLLVAAHEELGDLLGRQAVGELLQQRRRTVGRRAAV
jgi:hypothetical protein